MNRRNISSSLRTGWDYQDIWALSFCADVLENPDRFLSIRFEGAPDEIDGGEFSLDDIVLLDSGDKYHLYQAKHHDAQWTLADLLFRKASRRDKSRLLPSLLMKWADSLFRVEIAGKVAKSAFVTDASADQQLASILNGNYIDIDLFRSTLPGLFAEVVSQLAGDDRVAAFLRTFEFRFHNQNFDELRRLVVDRYHTSLRATDSGIDALYLRIKDASRESVTRWIKPQELSTWCQFDSPRALPQHFEVPPDFQLFDESVHSALMEELSDPVGGVKVLVGKPGSGKSTYVANLHMSLQDAGRASFRHHYFLSPEDESATIRLPADRAIEALKAQFKDRPELLGRLAHVDSARVELREFLSEIAAHEANANRAVIIIIDGLDHVLRSLDAATLKSFLAEISFPQRGLWLVLAMQSSAEPCLPGVLLQYCPRPSWIDVPGLTPLAVSHILFQNLVGLTLPDDQTQANTLPDRIYQLTSGNPLHLRYTLDSLKNLFHAATIHTWDCDDLLPFSGEIAAYYSQIWRQVPDSARTLALAVVVMKINLSTDQLHNLVATFDHTPESVSASYRAIRHLLRITRRGVSIYHNSFDVFLRQTPEYSQQQKRICEIALNWVSRPHSSTDPLKWFLVPYLSNQLGDSEQVMSLDRLWVASAIASGHTPYQINTLLNAGTNAAVHVHNFGRALKLNGLASYFSDALRFYDSDYARLWIEALWSGSLEVGSLDFASLQPIQILEAVRYADQLGTLSTIQKDSIDELSRRHSTLEVPDKGGQFPQSLASLPSMYLKVLAHDRLHSVEQVWDYITQFRASGWAPDLFQEYAIEVADTRQFELLSRLLSCELSTQERSAINDALIHNETFHHDRSLDVVLQSVGDEDGSLDAILWRRLRGITGSQLPALPAYREFPTEVSGFNSQARRAEAKSFSTAFELGVLFCIEGRESELHDWMSAAPTRWSIAIMKSLFHASIETALAINSQEIAPVDIILHSLSQVVPLKYPQDGHTCDLQMELHTSISGVLRTCVLIDSARNLSTTRDHSTLLDGVPRDYYGRIYLLRFVLDQPRLWLTDDSARALIAELQETLHSIQPFSDRVALLIDLARLARIHKQDDLALALRLRAANNLLGYGYHKDMYLYDVMHAVQTAHHAGSQKSEAWAQRLAPLIANVSDFTDGDETSQFPKAFGAILGDISPPSLRTYYYESARNEQLYLADHLFADLIDMMSFDSPEEIALGATAIDELSVKSLRSASRARPGAQESLRRIEAQLGEIQYGDDESHSMPLSSHSEPPSPDAILPERLVELVETGWDIHYGSEYLTRWTEFWLAQSGTKRRVLTALESVLNCKKLPFTNGRLLDLLYPLAYEFDPGSSFEYVCRAQNANYGWSPYYTDIEDARKRWGFIKTNFPLRYMEFFERSTSSRSDTGEMVNTYLPIVRSVEFFSMFDRLDIIDEMVEAAVTFAESLTIDLPLPLPDWTTRGSVDVIDLLLQRLLWPSPLVRERAADQIALLLRNESCRITMFRRLITWIGAQKLESIVTIGLLPVIRAASVPSGISGLHLQQLCDVLPVTSVVTRELVKELSSLTETSLQFTSIPGAYSPVPSAYQPTEFFKKYCTALLPPVYQDRLVAIGDQGSPSAFVQWAFVAEEIRLECGLPEEIGDIPRFAQENKSWTAPGIAPLLSEVYRSAFLRVIRELHERGLLDLDFYLDWSFGTCPIDLSYWGVQPARPPEAWPKMVGSNTKEQTSDSITRFRLEPAPISAIQDSTVRVLSLNGAARDIVPQNIRMDGVRFSVVGFGYSVIGSNLPSPQALWDHLDGLTIFQLPRSIHPFRAIDAYASGQTYTPFSESDRLWDLLITPLVARLHSLAIGHWQFYRGFGNFMVPCPWFLSNTSLLFDAASWSIAADDNPLLTITDWTDGLLERKYSGIPFAYGQKIVGDCDHIDAWLRSRNLRLAHVVKTVYNFKKNSYDDPVEHVEYQLIGLSPLISATPSLVTLNQL